MCIDIGKISADKDADKMGICLDQTEQADQFAAVLSAGNRVSSLDALSKVTIRFVTSKTADVPFVEPICAARATDMTSRSTWLRPQHTLALVFVAGVSVSLLIS